MNRDNYDMQMLKTMQRISRNLEIIARHFEPVEHIEEKPNKTDKMINPYQE